MAQAISELSRKREAGVVNLNELPVVVPTVSYLYRSYQFAGGMRKEVLHDFMRLKNLMDGEEEVILHKG